MSMLNHPLTDEMKNRLVAEYMQTEEGQEKLVAALEPPTTMMLDYRSIGLRLLLVLNQADPSTEDPVHDDCVFMADATATGTDYTEYENLRGNLVGELVGGFDEWVVGKVCRGAQLLEEPRTSFKERLDRAIDRVGGVPDAAEPTEHPGVGTPHGFILVHPDDLPALEAAFPPNPRCPTCHQPMPSDWHWEAVKELRDTGLIGAYRSQHVLMTEHASSGLAIVLPPREANGRLWRSWELKRVDGTEESLSVEYRMHVRVAWGNPVTAGAWVRVREDGQESSG